MAYMDLQDAFGLAPAPYRAPALPRAAALSPIEWLVVAIAEHDGIASLHAPSRLSRTLGALFGSRRRAGLANPQLEALRRMAVLLWRRGEVNDAAEIEAFEEAGYTADQQELIAASIAASNAKKGRRA